MEREEGYSEKEYYVNSHGDKYLNRTEIGDDLEKLRGALKLKGRTVKEEYNIIEAIRLLMVKLVERLEEASSDILNGFTKDERVEELDRVARVLIERGTKLVGRSEFNEGRIRVAGYIKEGYQVLARRDFEKFLIAIEWNYPMDMKFYEIRRNVLKDWVKDLEDLEYGRLKILSISAPPRTGKTTVGERFFLWCMLRHPEKSCFFVSHTAAMAIKVYNDIIKIIEDPKAEILNIFKHGKITNRNAEQLYIQLETNMSTGYSSAYFRGIDGNMAGVLEASWLLYCDDLIKNIEEAMNPDRLETARTKYGTDIVQRKANKGVRELHIATRWSTGDVISELEREHEHDDKAKFIRKPALDENGKSNFMYKGDYALDEEYFLERRNSPMMDEISFECIYQQNPMEREGLWLNEKKLNYFDGSLPEIECDLTCSGCDVAWGGGDYLSMPIAKVYGTHVYITDVVYDNSTKEITRPKVIGAIENNHVEKIIFEANNGGDEYCDKVKESLKKKIDIRSQKAPANKSKTARIMSVTDEVVGVSPEYQVYFLDSEARKSKPMYVKFMKDLFKYNTASKFIGRQKDDCADSLAILISQVLESRVVQPKVASNYSRKDIGF